MSATNEELNYLEGIVRESPLSGSKAVQDLIDEVRQQRSTNGELLEACKASLEYLDSNRMRSQTEFESLLTQLHAAIAKAEGK